MVKMKDPAGAGSRGVSLVPLLHEAWQYGRPPYYNENSKPVKFS